jgi:hypothetical protein
MDFMGANRVTVSIQKVYPISCARNINTQKKRVLPLGTAWRDG